MSDQSEEGGGGDGWEGTQTGTSGTRIEHDSDSRLFMEADKAKSQGQGCVTVKGRYYKLGPTFFRQLIPNFHSLQRKK